MKDYRNEPQDQEWERIAELLHEADRVPAAPDCRSAVMAHIRQEAQPAAKRWRWQPVRLAWSYGLALTSLVLIGIVAKPLIFRPVEQPRIAATTPARPLTPDVAKPRTPASAPATKERPTTLASAPVSRPDRPAKRPVLPKPVLVAQNTDGTVTEKLKTVTGLKFGVESKDLKAANRSVGYSASDLSAGTTDARSKSEPAGVVLGDRGRPIDDDLVAARPNIAAAATVRVVGDTASEADRRVYADSFDRTRLQPDASPVAVAVVTWPSQDGDAADSYSYGYANRDTATGETTECRVKRAGNSVEIYLESKPGPAEPPVKGSIHHETVPNA